MKSSLRMALTGALLSVAVFSVHAETMQMHDSTASTPAATAPVYPVTGVVEKIAPHALTLAHQAVPALKWPPMTMPFAVSPSLTLPALAVGDKVNFDVSLIDGNYQIVALTVQR